MMVRQVVGRVGWEEVGGIGGMVHAESKAHPDVVCQVP